MTTTTQLFETLNTLRVRNAKQPLKAWKESRAKLEAAINKELAAAPASAPAPRDDTSTMNTIDPKTDRADTSAQGTADPEKTQRLRAARQENAKKDAALAAMEQQSPSPSAATPAKSAAPAKKAAAKSKVAKAGFSAAAIIKEFGIDPRQGRALLRKHKVARTPAAVREFFQSRKK